MGGVRGRDNQRSAVYEWERSFTDGQLYEPTMQTLEQCQAFLNTVWNKEKSRYKASTNAPTIIRPNQGQRRATAHANHTIKLPKWARNEWVILHEAVHRLTPHNEAHGPRFMGALIGVLARHTQHRADELLAHAHAMGVRVYEKSIGTVPAYSLSEKLQRLLPISEMDAACEMDVNWRQVRGASITLIKQRKARWLRGKLVCLAPVPTQSLEEKA